MTIYTIVLLLTDLRFEGLWHPSREMLPTSDAAKEVHLHIDPAVLGASQGRQPGRLGKPSVRVGLLRKTIVLDSKSGFVVHSVYNHSKSLHMPGHRSKITGERKQHTSFCNPLLLPKQYFENVDFQEPVLIKIAMHKKRHLKKAYGPSP